MLLLLSVHGKLFVFQPLLEGGVFIAVDIRVIDFELFWLLLMIFDAGDTARAHYPRL